MGLESRVVERVAADGSADPIDEQNVWWSRSAADQQELRAADDWRMC
jgi:hypothetical protein